jgi:hypothetical protein
VVSGLPGSSFPLRRSEDSSSVWPSVTGRPAASHGVGCAVESCEHESSRAIGFPAPTSSARFPETRWFFLRAVPRSLASTGSSSSVLCLSFRVRSCLSPARHPCRAPSWGFVSPSRHERRKSTYHRASHTRLRFAPSVSRALDDFLLPTPCGPISSHCHVWDSHLREFPRGSAGSPPRCVVPS